jgi:hypothetical protein
MLTLSEKTMYHDLLKRTVGAMRVGKKININDPINHAVDIDTGIPCITTTALAVTVFIPIHNSFKYYFPLNNFRKQSISVCCPDFWF